MSVFGVTRGVDQRCRNVCFVPIALIKSLAGQVRAKSQIWISDEEISCNLILV